MAVTAQDKVFVVNANTNTKYGGVDPTGSFQTIDELKGYKVYTALLTQSGESDPQSQSSGAVEQGVTYTLTLDVKVKPWDFSNVGGPKFPENWSFVATSNDVPKEYGTATLNYDTGAPVATVLENTIGNIWFTYGGIGQYGVNSTALFTLNKTWNTPVILLGVHGPAYRGVLASTGDGNIINVYTESDVDSPSDSLLYNTPIEIRVYN